VREVSRDALQLMAVHKRFGPKTVLKHLDLRVGAGEIVAILGPSGGGKTTLLRLVAGLLLPDGGQIIIGGQDATRLPPERRRLGYVFQDYALWPHLSARQHLELVMQGQAAGGAGTVAEVNALLSSVGLLEQAQNRPGQLSGGQRQRVALARALAVRPELVLLDEPYSALDPVLRETLRGDVAALLRAEGRAALHVTHDPDEALSVADRLVVLSGGELVDEGVPERIYQHPRNLASARALGRLNEFQLTSEHGRVSLGELHWPSPVKQSGLTLAFRWEETRPVQGEEPGFTVRLETLFSSRGQRMGRYRLESGEPLLAPLFGALQPGDSTKLTINRPLLF